MEAHPAADLFPKLEGDALAALAADIKEHGLHEPITLHEGKILDGRNRWRACELAGVTPITEMWNGQGGTPTQYVISRNLHRRHLTVSQAAAVAVKAKPRLAAEVAEAKASAKKAAVVAQPRDGRGAFVPGDTGATNGMYVNLRTYRGRAHPRGTDDIAGEQLKVGGSSVTKASAVQRYDQEHGTDLFGQIESGGMTVNAAYAEVKRRREGRSTRTNKDKGTGKAGAGTGSRGSQQQRHRGGVPSVVLGWEAARACIRERLLTLDPVAVAQTFMGDDAAIAASFVKECTQWLGNLSAAMQAAHSPKE